LKFSNLAIFFSGTDEAIKGEGSNPCIFKFVVKVNLLPIQQPIEYILKIEERENDIWTHQGFVNEFFSSVEAAQSYCEKNKDVINPNRRYFLCVNDFISYGDLNGEVV
jgi:hypothetical protein